jgi:hypothetical protein
MLRMSFLHLHQAAGRKALIDRGRGAGYQACQRGSAVADPAHSKRMPISHKPEIGG